MALESSPTFLCLGEALIDRLGPLGGYPAHDLPVSVCLGGAPANVACALAKLGNQVGYIGRICNLTLYHNHISSASYFLASLSSLSFSFYLFDLRFLFKFLYIFSKWRGNNLRPEIRQREIQRDEI